MRCFKNSLGKYEFEDKSTYFCCGNPVQYYNKELGVWLKGDIEHDGNDYYFLCSDGRHFPLYDGIELKEKR